MCEGRGTHNVVFDVWWFDGVKTNPQLVLTGSLGLAERKLVKKYQRESLSFYIVNII
jgi:hypothetical protein